MVQLKSFLKTLAFGIAASSILFNPAMAAVDDVGSGVASLGAGSTLKIEAGLLGAYIQFGDDEPKVSGFYTKGRFAHFVILMEEGRVRNVSYDALFPGMASYAVFGILMTESGGAPWARVIGQIGGLANGELGYRYHSASIGIVNGIHPFFQRRWYHDAGVRLAYGKAVEWGLTFFEEDRFRRGSVQYGIKLDCQGYWGW